VLRLAEVPGIAGIKDATSDMTRHIELVRRLPEGRGFALYSGNDDTALPYILLGGHGVISVTANVAPRLMADMCRAALAGDLATARRLNNRLMPLNTRLFVEANPIPVKWALAAMGLIQPALRLPLVPLSEPQHAAVRAALRESGVLA
jgi:4-hydroxy-tetrahydrodipicolinate synthase